VAPILPTGEVGPWQATTPLPVAIVFPTVNVAAGRLYVVGGFDGFGVRTDVWSAPVHPDGTLGAWGPVTPLSRPRVNHSSVVAAGRLWVLGGYDGLALVDEVLSAPLNPDGTVGDWRETTRFPGARFDATAVAADGYMYLVGGNTDPQGATSPTNQLLWAPILDGGALGEWRATAPRRRGSSARAATSGRSRSARRCRSRRRTRAGCGSTCGSTTARRPPSRPTKPASAT
jgi:hypothetical protein